MSHPPYRVLGQLGLAALSLAVLAACSGKEHAATPNPPEAKPPLSPVRPILQRSPLQHLHP